MLQLELNLYDQIREAEADPTAIAVIVYEEAISGVS